MITAAPKGVIFHIEGFGVAVHLGTASEGLFFVISDSALGNNNPAAVLCGGKAQMNVRELHGRVLSGTLLQNR